MPRPPGVPAEFDVYTVMVLMSADDPPAMRKEELDQLQLAHLAYGQGLHERGLTVVNGPLVEQTDSRLRGLCIFRVGRDEAIEPARQDPSVKAGRLRAEVARWWQRPGALAFPGYDGAVGQRLPLRGHADELSTDAVRLGACTPAQAGGSARLMLAVSASG